MTYKVTLEYRSRVVVTVEAEDPKDAEEKALPEADRLIDLNAVLQDVTVREMP